MRDSAPILRDLVDRFQGTVRQLDTEAAGAAPDSAVAVAAGGKVAGKTSDSSTAVEAAVIVPDPMSLPTELSFVKDC